MYNVIIVERDAAYIQTIKSIIHEHFAECLVLDTVGSSREVINIVQKAEINIDIIIIDVKITGINGLETIKKIKQIKEEIRIIVLSEYDYVEFARQAVRLKVDDYIILPTSDYEVIQAIQSCIEQIDMIRNYHQTVSTVTSEYKEAKWYIEYALIYTVVFSKISPREVNKYVKLLDISTCGSIINIEIDESGTAFAKRPTLQRTLYELLHEHDDDNLRFVVGPRINRRIVAYVSILRPNKERYNVRLEGIMNELVDKIYERLQLQVRISLGRVEELSNMYSSYQDAIRNLRLSKTKENNVAEDVASINGNRYKELEKKFLTSLRINDGKAIGYLNIMLDCMQEFSEDTKRSRIIELLALTRHNMESFDWEKFTQVSFVEYLINIKNMPLLELRSWAHQTFEYIQNSQLDQNRMYSRTVWEAIQIIEHNYASNVTLEDVSGKVGVSSQYLSKIFKEETKETFVEWLTRIRINKAKELIMSTDQTIKEVGMLVGYKDPNYFSRIFRSVDGRTPTQFKEQIKNNKVIKQN